MKKCFLIISLTLAGMFVMGCQGPATPSITDDGESTAIVFKAASTEPPSNPEVNWAYYNTTDETWYIWDGSSWLVLAVKGDTGEKGETGANGADGSVATIGNNGNWFINGSDTGICAVGEKGDQGEPGQDYTLNNKLLVRWDQIIAYSTDRYTSENFFDLMAEAAESGDKLAAIAFNIMGYNRINSSAMVYDFPRGISNCCFDILSDQPSGYIYNMYIIVPEITYGLKARTLSDTIEYEAPEFYQGYHIEVWKTSDTTQVLYGRNYSLSKK